MTPDLLERVLSEAKVLALDTETDGLDWKNNKTCGYVITYGPGPDESAYLPFAHASGNGFDPRPLFRKIIPRRNGARFVFFNAAFDLKFFAADGVHFHSNAALEDGQINAFLINTLEKSLSLDACCKSTGVPTKKDDHLYVHMASIFGGEPQRRVQMQHFHKLPGDDPQAVEYAAGDGTATWGLWQAQQAKLDEGDLRYIWNIECRCIRTLHRMMMRGVRVNEERLHRVQELVHSMLERARGKLPDEFNDRSGPQHVKLFTDAGILDWPCTPKGNPSFTEEWLQTTELGRSIIAVRKLRNLDNSFLTPMLERHLWKGRCHTNYNQTRGEDYGTVTGRLSSDHPNLQQVPKRNEFLGALFRSIFIPDGGMIWSSADYEQIEPHLLAHYGKVRTLIEGYLSDPPVDAHAAVAREANIDRQSGKVLNQALITGAGVKKATLMLKRPAVEAAGIVTRYFAAMPEIKPFQEKAARIWQCRPLRSLLGRNIHLDNPRFAYKAVNRLLQVGNADILKKAMADIDEYYSSEGDHVHLLVNVHDDIGSQFREEDRAQYEKALEIMTDYGPGRTIPLTVPIEVDAKEGDSWAVASYGLEKVKSAFREAGGSYV